MVLDSYGLTRLSVHPDNPTTSEFAGIFATPKNFTAHRLPYFKIVFLWRILTLVAFQLCFLFYSVQL